MIDDDINARPYQFCPALIIEEKDLPEKIRLSSISSLGFKFGAWADHYASLSSTEYQLKEGRLDKIEVEGFAWKTALKIISYVATLFILPLIALIAKNQYKNFCNENIKLKNIEAEPQPLILQPPKPEVKAEEKKPAEKINAAQQAELNRSFKQYQIGKTTLSLKIGNIAKDNSQVLVNAANAQLASGSGVCGEFYKQAGQEIFDECEQIKISLGNVTSIPVGQAVLTTSGAIKQSPVVLHAVGPHGSDKNRQELMENVFLNSLKIAAGVEANEKYISDKLDKTQKYRSIAFPAISTGIFGYPLDEAADIAVKTIEKFVQQYPEAYDEINFVFLDPAKDKSKTADVYSNAFDKQLNKPSI